MKNQENQNKEEETVEATEQAAPENRTITDPDSAVYVVEPGYYQLPNYKIEEGEDGQMTLMPDTTEEGLVVTEIKFVKGPGKEGEEPGRKGITTLALLGMLIFNMHDLNSKLPSRETALAITKLEEAELWLRKRRMDRQRRGVDGTYNK